VIPQTTLTVICAYELGAPLERIFDIDTEHCTRSGGALTIVAAIEEPAVILRIPTHLGRPARAPPRASAPRS